MDLAPSAKKYYLCVLDPAKVNLDGPPARVHLMPSDCMNDAFVQQEIEESDSDQLCGDLSMLVDPMASAAAASQFVYKDNDDNENGEVVPSGLRRRQLTPIDPEDEPYVALSVMIMTQDEGREKYWESGTTLGPVLYMDGLEELTTEAPTLAPSKEDDGPEAVLQTPPPSDDGTEAPFVENSGARDGLGTAFCLFMGHCIFVGAFRLYDVDNDGYITRQEMYDIVDAIYQMVVRS